MLDFVLWQTNIFTDPETSYIGMRFLANFVVITILVMFIYMPQKKNKEYGFTFMLFNLLIFFVCYLMLRVEISIGFAFGLFAMFGILRYRTNTIPIKEMTYLFTAITLALVNAISPIDWTMGFMNLAILLFVFIMEKMWFGNKEKSKRVTYEKVDLIQAGHTEQIMADLKNRTQLDVTRFEINSMNLVNDTAVLKVFYTPDE